MAAGSGEAPLSIACIQMEPIFGDTARNVERTVHLMDEAADKGAQLVVLPELCNTGYVFNSRAEAFELAETIPSGPTVAAWSATAKNRGLYIVAGIAERAGEKLYNSAVMIGPEGYIGTFRKVHLWGDEHLYFEPGDLGFPVFPTPFGRIGMMICYDQWFPEAYRTCALRGADIVCIPTNWVPIPGQDPNREAMANIVAMAAAHTNSIYVAAADRIGTERGQPFIGQSLIVSYTGWPVGGPASSDKEEIVLATVNVSDARKKRRWNDHNQVVRDRRPDQYDNDL
ncbi:nitrilase family protein [Hyphomicrobium sp. 99]|uniref:nitrilase family protein n=1 Tax=Hyphomicrobium sp. 99 TaxID=1163419 RepID=UPI00210F4274|nr:nitrilase family protein [Hyphomicrobium sp. 99]